MRPCGDRDLQVRGADLRQCDVAGNLQLTKGMIEDFVKKNKAQLWIQHDYTSGIKRKIAPAYYD